MELKRITQEESKYYVKLDQGCVNMSVAYTLTPTEGKPGWDDVTYYGESIFDSSGAIRKPEWVYVLVNKSVPGVCKIGMTTTTVTQRANEINAATGVIMPWFPVFQFKCVNSKYLERDVHKHLEDKGYRLNPKREGFEIDSNTAAETIKSLGQRYQTPQDIEE
jgi:hypothetical protein